MSKLLLIALGFAALCPAQPSKGIIHVRPRLPITEPSPYIDSYQLTHAWRFDEKSGETLGDNVGAANGVLGGPRWVTQGLDFVAANTDRVEFANFVNPGTVGAFSLMAVANVVDAAGAQTIFSQTGSAGRSWMYLDSSEELKSMLGGIVTGHGRTALRGWHTFLLTYDGRGALKMCVDCSCTSAPRTPEASAGNHFLGASETLTGPFDEKMAYLLFYTRELTTSGRRNDCQRNHLALGAILMTRGVRLP